MKDADAEEIESFNMQRGSDERRRGTRTELFKFFQTCWTHFEPTVNNGSVLNMRAKANYNNEFVFSDQFEEKELTFSELFSVYHTDN